MQQLAPEASRLDRLLVQFVLDADVDGGAGWIVAPVPEDGFGAALSDDSTKNLERLAAGKHQPSLAPAQRSVERCQRMMQPPGLRGPERTGMGRGLADIEEDDRPPGEMGCIESLVVVKAQILAKPQNDRFCRVLCQ
ncbi:hypothetical protein GGE23_001692 [Rhizobium leguminosarum]|nr:hypothetical protein [Rhizobium leguminosarum]MBB4415166.1 hypothetical protein [Rhizobium leguminosarum]MBB4528550.1 hypothetical protein [Rhizobium leguminosarum]MBB4539517.1 hypothetical protein [Rhizobium leguminosarum]MBB5677139.1 hypothetical protein [Rhizobium leguminosarum]